MLNGIIEHQRIQGAPRSGEMYRQQESKINIIATALIFAIRTAKWGARSSTDAQFSDVDVELDKEASFAARISIRVMHELLRRHESLFPQRTVPIYKSGAEQDSPP